MRIRISINGYYSIVSGTRCQFWNGYFQPSHGHLGFFIRVLSACVQHPCCLSCGESVISDESFCEDQKCEWWNTYDFYFKYKMAHL
jgi:hypothetical protein